MSFVFKTEHSESERRVEATRILTKYPDRIPVIAEVIDKHLPVLEKKKYLVPAELTLAQFVFVLRKRIELKQDQALFIFCGSKIPPSTTTMSHLYLESKDPDGFLYLMVTGENAFGFESFVHGTEDKTEKK